MIHLVQNELFKISKQKKSIIFSIVILFVIVLKAVNDFAVKSVFIGEQRALIESTYNGQTYPLLVLSSVTIIIVAYIVILLADLLADEYKNGTLKITLLGPITRIKVLISKAITLYIAIVCIMVFTLINSYLVGTAFLGWGEYNILNYADTTSMFTSFSTQRGIAYTLIAYLITSVVYFSFGMIIFFLTVMIRNVGGAIGASFGFYFVVNLLGMTVKKISPYFITSYFDFYSVFGKTQGNIEMTSVLIGTLVIFSTGILFFVLSIIAFTKKDILI